MKETRRTSVFIRMAIVVDRLIATIVQSGAWARVSRVAMAVLGYVADAAVWFYQQLRPEQDNATARSRAQQPANNRTETGYLAAVGSLKRVAVSVVLVSAFINVLMLTGSIYMLQVYDRVLSSGSVPTLIGLFVIVIVLFVFLGLFDFLRARMLSRCSAILDVTAGSSLFARWVSDGDSRRIQQPPLSDLDTIRGFLTGPGVTALLDLPWSPMFLAILFLLHPLLGWATVAGAAIGGVLAVATWKVTSASAHVATTNFEAERVFAAKSHRMSELVRAMGLQPAITTRWRQLRNRGLAATQQGTEPAEVLKSASKAVRLLTQSTILTVGALLVLRGELSAGLIIASSILSGRALAPIDQLVGSWQGIIRARSAHARLTALSHEAGESAEKSWLPNPVGNLNVVGATLDVPFGGGKTRRILDKLTFDLTPGDALGVLGSSASGKTTLARLLVGVVSPTDGEVRLDGATFDQWGHDRVGRFIGYLPQRVDLLDGTVADNIARLDPAADDREIVLAAQRAGLHEMILRLPDGYQTVIGGPSGDTMLSGGQIQRIALARAIYGDPKLVVLDEPNAHLDRDGDKSLTDVINGLRARRVTVVVIAHRPSALEAVNKLLILDEGRIKSFGPVGDVMKNHRPETITPPAPKIPASAGTPDGRVVKKIVGKRRDVSVVRGGMSAPDHGGDAS